MKKWKYIALSLDLDIRSVQVCQLVVVSVDCKREANQMFTEFLSDSPAKVFELSSSPCLSLSACYSGLEKALRQPVILPFDASVFSMNGTLKSG